MNEVLKKFSLKNLERGKQIMKKNKMMRLASVLLVLVMLTTCVISGTFAKYVTADDAHDEARVAKWGIVITATDDADSKVVVDTKNDANEADISIAKDLKLLAPGTKGNIAQVNIKGQPEVAFDVSISVNLDLGDKWEVGGSVYCPLVFKVFKNNSAPCSIFSKSLGLCKQFSFGFKNNSISSTPRERKRFSP